MSVDGESVSIRPTGILKQWRAVPGGDIWVGLRTDEPDVGVVDAAALAANEDAEARVSPTIGSFISPTRDGYVIGVLESEGRGALFTWLETFAAELGRRGVAGELFGQPTVGPPDFMKYDRPPEPAAWVWWTIDLDAMAADAERWPHWFVPAAFTDEVAAFATRWAHHGTAGGTTYLRQAVHRMRIEPASAAVALSRAASLTSMAALQVVVEPDECRHVALYCQGHGVFQVVSTAPWRSRLDDLRSVLTEHPDRVDVAFIRTVLRGEQGVPGLANAQSLPGIHEADVRYNPHLLARFVPDAHGIQVLTDAHLERAHDLSAWTVTSLGSGRHLVEAEDLGPWYAARPSDPDVVERARADFGSMLLTKDAIAANPPPW